MEARGSGTKVWIGDSRAHWYLQKTVSRKANVSESLIPLRVLRQKKAGKAFSLKLRPNQRWRPTFFSQQDEAQKRYLGRELKDMN